MDYSVSLGKRQFPRSFLCTWISVLAFAISIPVGVWAVTVLHTHAPFSFTIQSFDPYAGCDLPVEYCVRAARLCLSTIGQLLLVWAAAYVQFEKPMLTLLFGMRGLCLGMALRLCLYAAAPAGVWLCIGIHTLTSLIFLSLIFHIRTSDGIRPMPDSLTAMLIAGGFACGAVILSSLSFSLFPV